ncbi:MAG: YidC/Oxa1 family membrane protein insertase [Candidatus Caldatribacteriota bacterium]|nr:YidC/Oxa1 family membrane protein insertase [Candidatus Caldatribacteriota bacterium]
MIPCPNHCRLPARKNDFKIKNYTKKKKEKITEDMWSSLTDLVAKVLTMLFAFTHNYGVAIILLTIVIRLILYPLMQKQMVSMREMQKIQPLMKAVQEKYKNDKERLNKELMALYKEHKVNPMSGCLPLLIQMPILILLFQTLRKFEYKNPITDQIAGGFLWIADKVTILIDGKLTEVAGLAAPEQLIHLPGSGIFGLQALGIMPFLVAGSMWYQQKMTTGNTGAGGGKSTEQTQKMMTIMMPLMIGVMSFSLPSGLTLYWLTSTLLGIGQQYLINKKMPTAVATAKDAGIREKKDPVRKELKKKAVVQDDPWIPGYKDVVTKKADKYNKKNKKFKKSKK